MESSDKRAIKNLIPVLSAKDKENVLLFYKVYEKHRVPFFKQAAEVLKNHPVFDKVIQNIPKETEGGKMMFSGELLKVAVSTGDWLPYFEYQMERGISYAKAGLDFKSWYEITSLVRKYFVEHLVAEYGTGDQFLSALIGMNSILDLGMSVIGESYIQEKKRIIRETSQQLSSVYDTTSNVLFILDVEKNERYKFSSVNKSFTITTGIPYAAVVGKYVHEIIPQPSLDLVLGKYREAIRGKKIVQWEETSQYPTGLLTAEVNVVPVFDDDGNCNYLVGAVHDITKHKEAETIIRRLNEELEHKVVERTVQLETINKELESFSYSVSHDLRAPLRVLNGYAGMLKEDYGAILDEGGKSIIKVIGDNADKMGRLIDELLAFSKLGRKELQKKIINMNSLAEAVMNEINKCMSYDAEIKIGNLHQVKADYALLHQAVFNLISNAIKYSSKKEHSVVELSSEEKNGEVVFKVKDNGVGFEMKYANKLFGVFHRLHSEKEFEGTGVGLAIVQRVIEKHGGRVWAEGKENEGAIFYFSLPVS